MMNAEKRLKIPKKSFTALEELAKKRNCSVDEVMRHCINTEYYMNEQLEKDNVILCQTSDGEIYRVVFSHMT
jgi:hypothetical protein